MSASPRTLFLYEDKLCIYLKKERNTLPFPCDAFYYNRNPWCCEYVGACKSKVDVTG